MMISVFLLLSIKVSVGLFVPQERFSVLENYALTDTPIRQVDMVATGWTRIKCCTECLAMDNCKSVSVHKVSSRCRFYGVSVAAIGSTPVEDSDWDTYTYGWQPIVKYSSEESTYNSVHMADFYDHQSYTASFPNDSCGIDPAEKCDRPYKHTLKDRLLDGNEVTEVKLSVYKDGVEEAWVTFSKNPGSDDVWFHPSRVIDSHPWDKTLLQDSASQFSELVTGGDYGTSIWSLSEGSKFNSNSEDVLTAHARWLVLNVDRSCSHSGPILYSKEAGPAFLIKREIGMVHLIGGGHQYDILGTEADSVCSNYLHTRLATKDELENLRATYGVSCCAGAWVDVNGVKEAWYPMAYADPSCGSCACLIENSLDTSQQKAAYCKKDEAAVGEADTLVISVKLG